MPPGPLAYCRKRSSSACRDKPINALHHNIHVEQIRLIYQQGPVMVLGATLIGLLMAGFLWPSVPRSQLLGWVLLILLSATLRAVVFRYYQRRGADPAHSVYWGRLFWLGSLAAGCVWGALPLLFYKLLAPEYLLLISTIFAGMVSVTAAAGSIYMPSFYAFAVPLVVPVSLRHLFSGVDYLAITGVMLLLYLLVNSLLARRGYRQYLELIEARFENTGLMEQLSAEKQTAEQAVIIKNQFLAAASHDLRQPLHALGMFIGSLRKRDTDPQRLGIIQDMETASTALSQLLHGMLDISRLEADVIKADIQPLVLHPILSALYEEFEPLAQQKQLQLDIPETDVVVLSDALLLERVLRNLLSNAVRYTQAGKISVTTVCSTPGSCELKVCDSGRGIEPHLHEVIFDDYFRVQDGDDRQSLGLGLAIVKRFCALMQVPIEMHSAAGCGTEFTLRIPTLASHSAGAAPASVESPIAGNCSVLLVDDELSVLKAMQGILRDWGCTVLAARSGKDALYRLAQTDLQPDIILCDYRLAAGELGVDTIEALREALDTALPAIVITGDTSPAILREVADRGLRVLHKPVAESALGKALRECLDEAGKSG